MSTVNAGIGRSSLPVFAGPPFFPLPRFAASSSGFVDDGARARAGEQVQIVQAYADEIAQVLRLARSGLTLRDVEQLGTLTFQSLEGVEDAALRLVLVRTFDVDGAAQRLGRDPSSERVWMKRRSLEV